MAPPAWPPNKINYIAEHIAALSAGPRGDGEAHDYICMAIAENKMTLDLMRRLMVCGGEGEGGGASGRTFQDILLDVGSCGYSDPTGDLPFRTALAGFFNDYLIKGKEVLQAQAPPHIEVLPQHLACVSGASAVMDVLLSVLTTRDEYVLIPAPHYAGYLEVVESVRLGTKIKPVYPLRPEGADPKDESFYLAQDFDVDAWLDPAALEASYLSVGGKAKMLVLTSPTNPTGGVFSQAALQGAVAWARGHGVHVVVDEVYACEVHSPDPARPYLSMLTAMQGVLGEDVHVVWSVSKTFAVAGWRVGVLLTQSESVRAAFANCAHMCEASRCALTAFRHCITQEAYGGVGVYLDAHLSRLKNTYNTVCDTLERHGIPYLPAQAGLFLLLDLRAYADTPEKERELYFALRQKKNVNVTPGFGALGCPPGWFRLCFAYNAPERTAVGMARIADLLRTYPKVHAVRGGGYAATAGGGGGKSSPTPTPNPIPRGGSEYDPQSTAQSRADWVGMAHDAIPSKQLHPTLRDILKDTAATGRAPTAPPHLLDLGCGNGVIGQEVAGFGYAVTGVDVNPAAVAHANTLAGVRARVADCTDPASVDDGTRFDVVLCQLVISVVGPEANRRGLLAAAARCLKPGGLLLLSASGDSAAVNEEYAALYARDRAATGEERTYLSRGADGESVLYTTHHFTEDELRGLLHAAGLRVERYDVVREASSRRPDMAAMFHYVAARRGE